MRKEHCKKYKQKGNCNTTHPKGCSNCDFYSSCNRIDRAVDKFCNDNELTLESLIEEILFESIEDEAREYVGVSDPRREKILKYAVDCLMDRLGYVSEINT